MHPALSQLEHRPWPLPYKPWHWRQSWHDLLFAHWPIPAAALRPLVPAGLTVQEFGGTSWIGLVPFRMTDVMRRGLPDLPWVSAFPELNVRLYVEHNGRPGVWFLSLDAANPLAVWAARRFFHLPYFQARMSLTAEGDGIRYSSWRAGRSLPARIVRPGRFIARPRHAGALAERALLPLRPRPRRLALAQRRAPRRSTGILFETELTRHARQGAIRRRTQPHGVAEPAVADGVRAARVCHCGG
jgi:uncharacterized protein YqjF (DUF2071 family)